MVLKSMSDLKGIVAGKPKRKLVLAAAQDQHSLGAVLRAWKDDIIEPILIGDKETIQILGVGSVPSRGVNKGLVVDIDETREAIRESVMLAERSSGVEIESAYVGVTGKHVSAQNTRGVVATTRSDKRVTADDLDRVLESARSIIIPSDRRLLHVIPRHYTLDEHVVVREPVGMHGFGWTWRRISSRRPPPRFRI